MQMIDIKLILAIISGGLAIIAFTLYIASILKRKTTPHLYSWLIWSILQCIATAAIIQGKGGYGALNFIISAILCTSIFILSLKFGTKNITKYDTICLVGSLFAIVIWIFTKDPVYSVILITIIDFIGFIPTYRKSYTEPNTEALSTYIINTIGDGLAVLALATYSLTTVLYPGSLVVTNLLLISILIYKRNKLKFSCKLEKIL